MYALALNGSPRKDGNTSHLLAEVLGPLQQGGWNTETIQVGGRDISGCIACSKCFENKDERCAVDTDEFNPVLEKMVQAQQGMSEAGGKTRNAVAGMRQGRCRNQQQQPGNQTLQHGNAPVRSVKTRWARQPEPLCHVAVQKACQKRTVQKSARYRANRAYRSGWMPCFGAHATDTHCDSAKSKRIHGFPGWRMHNRRAKRCSYGMGPKEGTTARAEPAAVAS